MKFYSLILLLLSLTAYGQSHQGVGGVASGETDEEKEAMKKRRAASGQSTLEKRKNAWNGVSIREGCLKEKQRQIDEITKEMVKLNCENCKISEADGKLYMELHAKRRDVHNMVCPDANPAPAAQGCPDSQLNGCTMNGNEINCGGSKVYKLVESIDESLRGSKVKEVTPAKDPSAQDKKVKQE